MIRRATKIVVEVIGAVAAAVAIGVALLGWRLSEGPIVIDFLAPTIEESLSAPDGSFLVDVDSAMIVWGGWKRALKLQAEGVHILGTERLLAELPRMTISVNLVRLLAGTVAPTHIDVTGPDIHVTRTASGALDFGLGAEMLQPSVPKTDESGLRGVLDLLASPSDWGPLGSLQRVSLLRANLVLNDEALGLTWVASDATARLARTDEGLVGWVGGTLELPDTEVGVRAAVNYASDTGNVEINANIDLAQPELLAGHVPDLAPLKAVQLPVQARLDALLRADGLIQAADLTIQGRVGALVLPDFLSQPVVVYGFEASAKLRDAHQIGDWSGIIEDAAVRITSDLGIPRPGAEPAKTSASIERSAGTPHFEIKARMDPVAPPVVADLASPLIESALAARLSSLDAPVRGDLLLRTDLGGSLLTGWIDLLVDRGTLTLPEYYDEPLTVMDAALHARVEALSDPAGGHRIALSDTRLNFGDFALDLDAEATNSPQGGSVALKAAIPSLAVDLLKTYWPRGIAVNPERWVTANLSDGTVEDLSVSFGGDWTIGAEATEPAFSLRELDGSFDVSGLTIRYSEKLPPARRGVAKVNFDSKKFDFAVRSAALKDLRVTEGSVVITGLDGDDHRISIDLDAVGPLRDVMEVIDGEPLRYARRIGHTPENFSGAVDARLTFDLPLLDALTFEEIDIGVTGVVTGLGVRDAVKRMDIDDGKVEVTLDNAGMDVAGTVRIEGKPISLAWRENFEKPATGPRFWSRYRVRGPVDSVDLATFWPDITEFAAGPLDLDVTYTRYVGSRSDVSLSANLIDSTVKVDALEWSKPAGAEGRASMVIALENKGILGINEFDFESTDTKVVGEIGMSPGSGTVRDVSLTRLKLMGSDLDNVTLIRDGGRWGVKVASGRLDLSRFFPEKSEDDGDNTPPLEDINLEPKLPVALDLDFGLNELVIGEDRVFGPLRAHIVHDGARWTKIAVRSRRGETGNVRVDFLRGRTDGPELVALIDDFGLVARSFGVLEPLRNGRLLLTGGFTSKDDPGRFVGRSALTEFRLVDPPFLAQLLTLASLTGIVDLLRTESGLGFTKLESRFTYRDKVLSLNHARGFSQALGVTASGDIDLGRGEIEIEGTIAPAYVLSQVIETIPLLGSILSPKGEGLFAAIYEVEGELANPGFTVNPFSALAPGFLRNIFRSSPDDAASEGRAAGEQNDVEKWFE